MYTTQRDLEETELIVELLHYVLVSVTAMHLTGPGSMPSYALGMNTLGLSHLFQNTTGVDWTKKYVCL